GIESIPMGYILIDGGRSTAVQRVSHTQPIPQTDLSQITDTAIAAELLGKRLVYLEAGSGADTPVSQAVIRSVRAQISVPLIVGGGIRTPEQMSAAFSAGADLVVIGNHFEFHPDQLPLFCRTLHNL
ncbi:MAG: geranylgeranylglyceryl/heptaprenylglyceryl phosphate synthase, partial [Paludibacteraceae bacterium]|nr:geranylgeranylglyceryl/heptaprenylglyceryl phosphate synthase [Paludibacteraceae bacterium]